MQIDENNIPDDQLLEIPTRRPLKESIKNLKRLEIARIQTIIESQEKELNILPLEKEQCLTMVAQLYDDKTPRHPKRIYILLCKLKGLPHDGTIETLYGRLAAEVCTYFICPLGGFNMERWHLTSSKH